MQQFQNVIDRLEALEYDERLIERLKIFQAEPESTEIRVIDIRVLLESSLKIRLVFQSVMVGPRFKGDFSRPVVVRQFLQSGR